MKIAERLLQLRQESGLTLRELSEKVGITAAALSSYEKGKKEPSLEFAVKLAKYYGKTLDSLCGVEDIEQPQSYADVLMFMLKTISESGSTFRAVPNGAFASGEGQASGKRIIKCELRAQEKQTTFIVNIYGTELPTFFETYAKLSELAQNNVIPTSVFTSWLATTLEKEARLPLVGTKLLGKMPDEEE